MSDYRYGNMTVDPGPEWSGMFDCSDVSDSIVAFALIVVCLAGQVIGWRKVIAGLILFISVQLLTSYRIGFPVELSDFSEHFASLIGIIRLPSNELATVQIADTKRIQGAATPRNRWCNCKIHAVGRNACQMISRSAILITHDRRHFSE
jgi:hypothetical protein